MVGEGGEYAAAQNERGVVDRSRLDPGDLVVIPVDGRFYRTVSTEDKAIVLGCALILIEAPSDIQALVVVLHQDMAVVFWPRLHLFLISRELVDLQFFRLKLRANFEKGCFVILDMLRVIDGETRGVPVGFGGDHGSQRLAADVVGGVGLCP